MPTYRPLVDATCMPLGAADGLCVRPPMYLHVPSSLISRQANSGSDGRFVPATGELEGELIPVLQDTYKDGTSGRTGYAFTVVSGVVHDDWVVPGVGKYGLLFPDGRTDQSVSVLQTEAVNFTAHRIVVTRGKATSDSGKTSTDAYILIELNYGQPDGSLRIALYNNLPPMLQTYGTNEGLLPWDFADFQTVAAVNEAGSGFQLFDGDGGRLVLDVVPDRSRGLVTVRLPKGRTLRYVSKRPSSPRSAPDPNGYGVLPLLMRVAVQTKNGAGSLEVYPLRWTRAHVKYVGPQLPKDTPLAGASVRINQTGPEETSLSVSDVSVTRNAVDNLCVEATVTRDYDDDVGSEIPIAMADMVVELPGRYATGYAFTPPETLPVFAYTEMQVWDDMNRLGTTSGTVSFHNRYGQYANRAGNQSVIIRAGALVDESRVVIAQRCRGIIGHGDSGWQCVTQHPASYVQAEFSDKMAILNHPLGQELVLDGFSVNAAVRAVLLCSGITPGWLTTIPDDGPPPYAFSYAFRPILGKGTGQSPRNAFPPQTTGLQALMTIMSDLGYPTTRGAIPYMFWFDPFGYPRLMPYDPSGVAPKRFYSTRPNISAGHILIEAISVSNNIKNLRTDVSVQGQDALTGELIHAHVPLYQNRGIVGHYFPAFARSSSYVSQPAVEQAADVLARECSLGTTIARIATTFDPYVFAGDVVMIDDPDTLRWPQPFTILSIQSELGHGDAGGSGAGSLCRSQIVARSLRNSVPM